jgi:hypothetical protein
VSETVGNPTSTARTYTVTAVNANGTSAASAASNSIAAVSKPQAPTIGTVTLSGTTASVPFTAGATGGAAVSTYTATSSPGGFTGTSASSPISVSGLSIGTEYTFTVTATNSQGTSSASSASNGVTPGYSIGSWSSTTNYPITISGISGVTFGSNDLYAGAGQNTGSGNYGRAVYSFNGSTWTLRGNAGQQSAVTKTSATFAEFFGDNNNGYQNAQGFSVTSGSSMSGGRDTPYNSNGYGTGAASVGSGTSIIVSFQGPNGNDSWYRNAFANSWTSRTEFPTTNTPQYQTASPAHDFSRAYFASASGSSATVYYVTSTTGSWSTGASLPVPGYNTFWQTHNDLFTYYVANRTTESSTIYMYDGSTSTSIGSKNSPTYSAYASRGTTIYQIAGGGNTTYQATVS